MGLQKNLIFNFYIEFTNYYVCGNYIFLATLSTSVEVFLLPGFVFPKCEKLRNRTAVVKRTVNPFYGKEFLL